MLSFRGNQILIYPLKWLMGTPTHCERLYKISTIIIKGDPKEHCFH
jgi:hypothetical protein